MGWGGGILERDEYISHVERIGIICCKRVDCGSFKK